MKDQVRQHILGCDVEITAAIADRLTFAGQIIETGSTSYRLAHARNAPRKLSSRVPGREPEAVPPPTAGPAK